MVKPLLEELRTKVQNACGLTDTAKSELLKLVADLENQTGDNPTIRPDDGEPGSDKLTKFVEELEVSHPDITDLANRIATMLANMGI